MPYAENQIKDAPSFGSDDTLSPENEQEIYSHYDLQLSTEESPTGYASSRDSRETVGQETLATTDSAGADVRRPDAAPNTGFAATEDGAQAGVVLSEEELQVGKRQVESGQALPFMHLAGIVATVKTKSSSSGG